MGSNMAECHPIAFRFVLAGAGARRDGHPRRPALHPHLRPVRYLRADPRRHRHRLPRRPDPLHPRERPVVPGIRAALHQPVRPSSEDDFSDTSELRRALLRMGPEKSTLRRGHLAVRVVRRAADTRRIMDVQTGESYGDRVERPRPAAADRPDAAGPQLRLPDPAPPLRAYTPEMVERITGCPQRPVPQGRRDARARPPGREKTASICYAVGWTHHTTGVQMIRAAAIIQSLLGNIGRPGGGILALRGHSTHPGQHGHADTLQPAARATCRSRRRTRNTRTSKTTSTPSERRTGGGTTSRSTSSACCGPGTATRRARTTSGATSGCRKITGDHSQLPMTLAMQDGAIRGLLRRARIPVVGGHNAHLVRMGLRQSRVAGGARHVRDRDGLLLVQVARDAAASCGPAEIKTEVFLMPAALPGEKEGTFTNTHRLIQWHDKVVDPPGDCRSELWFKFHLGRRLKELYAGSAEPQDEPDPEPDLGLPRRRSARRAVGGRDPAGNQRLHLARPRADRGF